MTTFPNGFDVGCERQKKVKIDFEVLVQATGRTELPLIKMGKTRKAALGGDGGGEGVEVGVKSLDWEHIKFEIS